MPVLPAYLAPPHPHLHSKEIVFSGEKGKGAVLLIHGFTGTPEEMRSLIPPLQDRGYSGKAIVLPGHGTHPQDLKEVRFSQWIYAVKKEYRELLSRYGKVGVVGLSMGAVLAQFLLREDPPPSRIVLLSVPYRIEDTVGRFVLPFVKLFSLRGRWIWLKEGGSDISLPEERWRFKNYRWVPLEALGELYTLLSLLRLFPPSPSSPALLIHSRNDHTVPLSHPLKVFRRLGERAYLLVVEDSFHVLTRDREKDLIAEATARFLSGEEGDGTPLLLKGSWVLHREPKK